MKKYAGVLALSLAWAVLGLAASRADEAAVRLPAKERFHLYLLIGQSNMAGRGAVEEQDKQPHPRVLMFTRDGKWAPAVDPLHFDKPTVAGVGLGSSFGRAMAEANPEIVVGLIPCAVGGTPLERWQRGGDLHRQAVERAKAAQAQGTLRGILWHQGESDAGREATAASYGQRLAEMVVDLRRELKAADVPFVAGQLGQFLARRTKQGQPSYWPLVNEQIDSLPSKVKNAAVVESAGLKAKSDNVHFDSPSLREFGKRYAAAILKLQDRAAQTAPSAASRELPWDLKKLFQPPEHEWLDTKSPVRSLLYEGEPYGGKPTRVFAYYATPATLNPNAAPTKKLPAVVLVHGGGGTAFREWAELWARRGYAAIAMDLAGSRPVEGKDPHNRGNRTRLADGGPAQSDAEKFGAVAQPVSEQWPYHAVANVLRAHSLLRSFDEIDADRTAVTGISWGGYLTCIVAGVDNRFQAAVPVYGCGFLYENSAWLKQLGGMSPNERQRWIELWDPSRYLPAVSMPILFINGTNDFAYPLDSYMKSFDAVPGAKQIRVTVNMPHGHPPGWAPAEIGLFVDHHLRGGKPLPTVGKPRRERDKALLTWSSPVEIKQSELHWTEDNGAINQRTWHTAAATIDTGSVTAAAPPEAATAWFLTVTDERNATVSSRVVMPKP